MKELVTEILLKAREYEKLGEIDKMQELDNQAYRLIPLIREEERRLEKEKGIIHKIKGFLGWQDSTRDETE